MARVQLENADYGIVERRRCQNENGSNEWRRGLGNRLERNCLIHVSIRMHSWIMRRVQVKIMVEDTRKQRRNEQKEDISRNGYIEIIIFRKD